MGATIKGAASIRVDQQLLSTVDYTDDVLMSKHELSSLQGDTSQPAWQRSNQSRRLLYY